MGDYCVTGTPNWADDCQHRLQQIENELMATCDLVKDACGKADPLTELALRDLIKKVANAYSSALAIRTTRKVHYASNS